MAEIVGRIVEGSYARLAMREKRSARVQLGELVAVDEEGETQILQVVDFTLASQISQANRELIAGIALEEGQDLPVFDEAVRSYALAHLKPLVTIRHGEAFPVRRVPLALSDVRRVTEEDFAFLTREKGLLPLGRLRSGSRVLDIPIRLPLRDVLSHHVLIAAQTGKGKSNLVKTMLARMLDQHEASFIVFDAHDEYYGRTQKGLKDVGPVHAYSPQPAGGMHPLFFSLRDVKPDHVLGVYAWSDAQLEALYTAYRAWKGDWLENLFTQTIPGVHDATLTVLRRRLANMLGIRLREDEHGVRVAFDETSLFRREESMLSHVFNQAREGGVILIDTSRIHGPTELLVMTLIATHAFTRARQDMSLPLISLVVEEAPRVLGRNVLAEGNVFERIAREGRKFGVGLVAITQMPSLLQRDVLANMNTKIILGLEMAGERQAVIESAAQDIRSLDQAIASLEKGEGFVTSIFTRMPLPFKADLFDTLVTNAARESRVWS